MEISKFDEVIVGTNEEYILGYNLILNKDGRYSFTSSFIDHSHLGSVKQVAVCRKFLVSGSTDEFIKVFDLTARKEVGDILSHNGSILCLQFHESGFLLSGSEDGRIGIYREKTWQLEKELKGHKASVTGIAIHPSGKLGLSISKDKKMIAWDLMKGTKAFVVPLKTAGDVIAWAPSGKIYLIASLNILKIYKVEDGNILQSIDFKDNIYCWCFITDNLLVVGGERKSLSLFCLESRKEIIQWPAHDRRTKSLVLVNSENETYKHIASASSDGYVRIWNIDLERLEDSPKLLGEVDTKCRIICMSLHRRADNFYHEQPEEANLNEQRKTPVSKNRKQKNSSKIQNFLNISQELKNSKEKFSLSKLGQVSVTFSNEKAVLNKSINSLKKNSNKKISSTKSISKKKIKQNFDQLANGSVKIINLENKVAKEKRKRPQNSSSTVLKKSGTVTNGRIFKKKKNNQK